MAEFFKCYAKFFWNFIFLKGRILSAKKLRLFFLIVFSLYTNMVINFNELRHEYNCFFYFIYQIMRPPLALITWGYDTAAD